MGWTDGPVLVRTPATSANLGPGFDSLGLALSLHDDVEVELTGGGLSIEVDGEGAEVADRGERHLIVKVVRRTFDRLDDLAGTGPGGRPAGLRLRCRNRIPHSRGLGSSSAAIVAGIVAARALHPAGELLGDDEALRLATEIEGHPDNVAPCLAGGLTVAWTTPDGPRLVRLESQVTQVTAYVPEQRLATERARGLLPETVPHGDAAANAGRAALLVAALTGGLGADVLLDATEDRLHQNYRAPAMPDSAELVGRLRAAGVPAVISGAGPTVLAFTSASQVDSIAPEVGNGWLKHPLDVATRGARVVTGESTLRP
ncbi:homoserine kinase [Actinomadura pelletieri DSM 43383]|uniref:Homoserine kinase n=1 Tax=Actinomadura pelletieri DSM 43383 TaxID=1120940 RepID=A0A495QTA4_9ACTN|nr:homoserine kinase [Actinomadura pelletieri]RKS76746.1 homoserine kinase [Actinomadura pelletieri DSM 43383]